MFISNQVKTTNQVSPQTTTATASLGTSVDCVRAALVNSKIIIEKFPAGRAAALGIRLLSLSLVT
ncbi:hypothetical protein MSG28_014591 [Choristoneura fumiferana]|uniref:Uncharacterized protein n=1 Tax=Choristoneura fumiferana TaxID=7141 RepID=A0ACC0JRX1_CHOFU|nr:hypothetical protein MSG28_014591 [Choristoneura fumiferana]